MAELAPGFRFYPTEQELICFYLNNKLEGKILDQIHQVIPVVDIYDRKPNELPNLCGELCKGDTEQWFFFTPRQEREVRGGRPSRTTETGYWKATGSPNHVYSSDNKVVGLKKTMVFHEGKAPFGKKTTWKMNEYRAIHGESTSNNATTYKLRHEYALCRIYVISGTFQAFDRRPFEVIIPPRDGSTSTSSQIMVENMILSSSSPETSQQRGDHEYLPEITEGPTTDNEMSNAIDEPPLSEWDLEYWEQLNWD
ncbi:hypothetical protein ACFE04_027873 [Oxalis oulophora]